MKKRWGIALALTISGSAFAVIIGGGGSLPGTMTGGGSILSNGIHVTHGFELNCDSTQVPQSLEINFDSGHQFHLDQLTMAYCYNNPNIHASPGAIGEMNTYTGSGTGTLDGVPGATVNFLFSDAGEPGTSDVATYTITDANGATVLSAATGTLTYGNHQAHD